MEPPQSADASPSCRPARQARAGATPVRLSAAGGRLAPCAAGTRRAPTRTTSSRSSRSSPTRPAARSQPDYNVAPTHQVPVVLERPPRADRAGAAGAPAAAAHLGAGAVLGQGPEGRQPDDQRAGRVAVRQAGLQAGGRRPALPGAGGRLVRVAGQPDRARTPRASRASSRSSPTSRTAAGWSSAGSTSSGATHREPDDDPDAWLTTFTIVTGPAEPGLDRLHDRMPFVVPRERWDAWLDPSLTDAGRGARAARAAAARPVRRLPGVPPGRRRAQRGSDAAGAGAAGGAGRRRRPDDRRGARADARRLASPPPGCATSRRRSGLARAHVRRPRARGRHAGARARRRRRDRREGPRRGRPGRAWTPAGPSRWSSSRGGWPASGSPRRRRGWTRPGCRWCAALRSGRGALPGPLVLGGRSAGARVACRTATRAGARTPCWRSPSRCTRPASPNAAGPDELALVGGLPLLVVQGRRDPFGGPQDVEPVLPSSGRVVAVDGDHGLSGGPASGRGRRPRAARAS